MKNAQMPEGKKRQIGVVLGIRESGCLLIKANWSICKIISILLLDGNFNKSKWYNFQAFQKCSFKTMFQPKL